MDTETRHYSLITPQSLGLSTEVHQEKDGILIDIATINPEMKQVYENSPLSIDEIIGLYHHTVFSMSYALSNMLHVRKQHWFTLHMDIPEHIRKKSGPAPKLTYHTIDIVGQPDHEAH